MTSKRRPRIQFSMRMLILFPTIVASLLGILFVPLQLEQRRMQAIHQVGGQVYTEPRGHIFLQQILGDSFAQRAVYVHLRCPMVDDAWLAKLAKMKHIEMVSINSPNLTDEGLEQLSKLPALMDLNLVNTQVTQSGIDRFQKRVPTLRLVTVRDD